jgi:GGDEF domain-containing protein
LTLTVSIGVVTLIPHKDTSFDTFYRLADEGLYIAKKSNKSTWKRTYLRLTPAPEKTEATHA